jgi:hypothetical protein
LVEPVTMATLPVRSNSDDILVFPLLRTAHSPFGLPRRYW